MINIKVKKLLNNIPLEIIYILIALVIAIYIHEFGHYTAAKNYGLDAKFGIDKQGFFVETFSTDEQVNSIINHSGPIFNLLLSFIALASILILPKANFKLLFIIIAMTNTLVALISLSTFAYTGVL